MEFFHILNKFAAQLDDCLSFKDFCLKQNSKASYRRKLGGSAICSKYEQNSTASRSVAYLFFIIYSNSTVGQLEIKIYFSRSSTISSKLSFLPTNLSITSGTISNNFTIVS
ncbi:hypothetical protein DWV72_05135 [Firmicutes bacterium AF12-30]|nr:hypothetical protein DWV72_05135 [Firmicutes bacterium AF12-30]